MSHHVFLPKNRAETAQKFIDALVLFFSFFTVVDLFIVPGLAFTMRGERLGRGKGYYDRYIAGLRELYRKRHPERPRPRTLALAFSEQILDEVFTEKHDYLIDAVIHA